MNALRLVVIGNSGSGKSTLAKRIADSLNIEKTDLDHVYWTEDGQVREHSISKSTLKELTSSQTWLVEGVFENLLEIALRRANALIWLDLSWTHCRKGLLDRGNHYGMNPNDDADLRAWEDAHRKRRKYQSEVYSGFMGRKWILRDRQSIAGFDVALLSVYEDNRDVK